MALQNFFGCAGNLGEGAARKLFHKYATSDILAEQLTLVATTNTVLVTEQPDAMKAACMSIGMALSPPAANPCCQGSAGCTSITASASNSNYPPFMTVAVTACVGDSACKDMGPNPLILDASCTGVSACESMNQNEINPFITGVTFVGEGACTNTQSCEGVGHRSHGDVTIQTGACISPKACYSAGRRVKQSAPSFRYRSHIDIGPNACVGSNACKDAHSTVSSFPGGKREGSLTIGDGGCADEGSCEKLGLNDRMRTDIIVPPGGCGGDQSCWACMTKSECDHDAVYVISDAEGACPKGGRDTNFLPTGDKVEKYCVGKDTLPTECPTFFPTPLPTVSSEPTPIPTNMPTDRPSSSPSRSQAPTTMPTDRPSSSPSRSQAPTATPRLEVGCLEGPGNVASTFNTISDQVLCDDGDGACTDFVDAVEGLPGNGDRMIKSIFGCNDDDTPGIVAIGEAQDRFDKIKNDRDMTELLVKTVAKGTRLFTGSQDPLQEACGTDCCTDLGDCDTILPGVMTVSENSCMDGASCLGMIPDTIIIESCVGDEACGSLGGFNSIPHPDVKIGYWVIGPKACHGSFSCCSLGLNIFGNVRIKSGACDGRSACFALGRRNIQDDTASPTVADISVGENACHGTLACWKVHARTAFMGNKTEGSLLIEQGACDGVSACDFLANSEFVTNDIVIKERVCVGDSSCAKCLQQNDCGGGNTMTYTISGAGDCPGPDPGACSLSN